MGKLDDLRRTAGGNIVESASRREVPVIGAATLAGLNPARMEGIARTRNALEIPLDRIERDPSQPREEFSEEALARLAESIRARGLLQPVRVRWSEERGKYVLIAGERRWRAAGMAGLPTLTCIVVEGEISPAELLAIQVTENLQREDLNPLERARAFKTLIELHGWSGNQLAKELGISQSSVVHALSLLELPEPVREQVERGDLPPATAYEVSKLPDADAQCDVAARVVAEGLSRSETIEAVRRASGRAAKGGKGRGAARARKATSRIVRTPAAKVTVELRKGSGTDAILTALRDAVRLIESELAREPLDAA